MVFIFSIADPIWGRKDRQTENSRRSNKEDRLTEKYRHSTVIRKKRGRQRTLDVIIRNKGRQTENSRRSDIKTKVLNIITQTALPYPSKSVCLTRNFVNSSANKRKLGFDDD